MQLGDDPRQRRPDDRLIQRREQDSERDADHREQRRHAAHALLVQHRRPRASPIRVIASSTRNRPLGICWPNCRIACSVAKSKRASEC